MKKLILTLVLLINTLLAFTQSGYALTGNNIYQNRTEIYKANSPTNNSNNRTVYSYMNVDSSISTSWFQIIRFATLSSPGESFIFAKNDGTLISKSFYSVIDTNKLVTKYFSNSTYQPIGNYLTTTYVPTWTSITGKPSFFDGNYNNLTNKPDLSVYTKYTDTTAMLSKYLLKSYANTVYQPKGMYLTSETDPVWLADSTNYLRKSKAAATYQLKGNYLTPNDTTSLSNRINKKLSVSDTIAMLSKYLLKSTASATYQVKGSYITTEVDPTVPTHVKSITSADITRWDTQQTLSVSGQTLSISGGNSVTLPTVDALPAMTSRSFNTNFTLANTTLCIYSIKILNGTALISASSAYAYLEYSTNAGTSWTTVSSVSREDSGLSLISISTKGNTMTLTGVIPAGALTRIRTTAQTGSSIELITSQETKL